MGTFQDAFSENPPPKPPVVEEEKPEVETPEVPEAEAEKPVEADKPKEPEAEKPKDERPREADGKFAKMVPQEALHAAREKARALEERLAAIEKKPKTSVLEDEDKAFAERLSEAVAPVRSQFFELTVELAKEKPGREDYDEVYQFMNAECEKHPELVSQIVGSRNPGEEIYRLGKVRKELAEVDGDLTKYRQHAVASVQKELDAAKERIKALEAAEKLREESQEKRAQIPQSTNAEPSGTPKTDVFAGPRPLKSVFGS
jgi:hypothetical protein